MCDKTNSLHHNKLFHTMHVLTAISNMIFESMTVTIATRLRLCKKSTTYDDTVTLRDDKNQAVAVIMRPKYRDLSKYWSM